MSDLLSETIEELFDAILDPGTSSFDRMRISSLRDRVRALEAENRELKARLAGRAIQPTAADPPPPTDRWAPPPERERRGDPWAVPADRDAASSEKEPDHDPVKAGRYR